MKPLLSCLLTIFIYFLTSSFLSRAQTSSPQGLTLEEWTALCYQLTKTAALKACDQAIKLDPKQEKLWVSKGNALFSLENYSLALEAYNKALEINKQSAINWQKKGEALAAQNQYLEAGEAFDQALLIDEKDNGIWFDKGLVLFLQNKEAEAEKAYDKFLVNKSLNLVLLTRVVDNTLEQFKSEEAYNSTVALLSIDNQNKEKKIILKSENNINSSKLFYSEIQVLEENKILSRLQIIGDGQKVWTYRLDLQEYTSSSYEEFLAGDKLIFTGLYNFFFLSIPKIKQAKFVILKTLLEITNTPNFQQDLDIIEGQSYVVYKYQSPDNKSLFKLWVNGDKALIKQVQFGLQSPKTKTIITEKISQSSQAGQSFKFTPPPNAKLVKELPNIYPDNFKPFH